MWVIDSISWSRTISCANKRRLKIKETILFELLSSVRISIEDLSKDCNYEWTLYLKANEALQLSFSQQVVVLGFLSTYKQLKAGCRFTVSLSLSLMSLRFALLNETWAPALNFIFGGIKIQWAFQNLRSWFDASRCRVCQKRKSLIISFEFGSTH